MIDSVSQKTARRMTLHAQLLVAIDSRLNDDDRLITELGRAFYDLARFNGCQMVMLENVQPRKIMTPLKKILKV